MRKVLMTLGVLMLVMGVASIASAIPVAISYTADNQVNSWTIGGVSQSLGAHAGDWGNADSSTIDLGPGSYDIVWDVTNWTGLHSDITYSGDWEHNPAGLLAEINFLGNDLLSSNTWQTSIDDGSTWSDAFAHGANNDHSTPWYSSSYHQGVIVGIGEDAQWIWSGDGTNLDHILIRTTVDIPAAHAPEPATLLLLGSGLIGLAGLSRKKYSKRNNKV